MKILNKSTKQVVEIKDKQAIKRMLRYPDIFEEVKANKAEETANNQ